MRERPRRMAGTENDGECPIGGESEDLEFYVFLYFMTRFQRLTLRSLLARHTLFGRFERHGATTRPVSGQTSRE